MSSFISLAPRIITTEINWKMHAVYGDECVLETSMMDWHQKFLLGQHGTSDEALERQAWAIATSENISKVNGAPCGLDQSCDFHVFCVHPKKALNGHRFMLDNVIKGAVVQ
jgi:molybdopterin-biosynthesis enzyme MoeA-like protein